MRQPLVMRWVAAFVMVLALAGCK
ncbi:MAG: hypothetical protein QOH29_3083, partial [Actinomycetota bacterium]|nr:hypothetical protein [Actinomycetota bacterium]